LPHGALHTAMALPLTDMDHAISLVPVDGQGRYIGGGGKFSNADARQGSCSRQLFPIVDRSARHAAMIAAGLMPGQSCHLQVKPSLTILPRQEYNIASNRSGLVENRNAVASAGAGDLLLEPELVEAGWSTDQRRPSADGRAFEAVS
jgi:hypothetical protein